VVIPSAAGLATLNSVFPQGSNANVDLFRQALTAAGAADAQFFNVPLADGRPDVQFGTKIFPYAQTLTDRQFLTKLDHQVNPNNLLSFRYSWNSAAFPVGGQTNGLPGFFTSQQNKFNNGLVSYTRVFSPSLTNEMRASYNRIDLGFPLDPTNPLGLTMPQISISGVNTGGSLYTLGVSANFPQGRVANNYVLQDTVTYARGRHNFRGGFDLLSQRSKQFAPIPLRGTLTYNASTGYSGFANFVDDFGGSAGGRAGRLATRPTIRSCSARHTSSRTAGVRPIR